MNLRMTIEAIAAEQVLRRRAVCQAIRTVGKTLMIWLRVTRLTKHRSAQTQHSRIIRAVRVVTVCAVFRNRCVFPKKRAAFFGVAFKTGIVQRLAHEQAIGRLPMRAMATATVHLPFVEWV